MRPSPVSRRQTAEATPVSWPRHEGEDDDGEQDAEARNEHDERQGWRKAGLAKNPPPRIEKNDRREEDTADKTHHTLPSTVRPTFLARSAPTGPPAP